MKSQELKAQLLSLKFHEDKVNINQVPVPSSDDIHAILTQAFTGDDGLEAAIIVLHQPVTPDHAVQALKTEIAKLPQPSISLSASPTHSDNTRVAPIIAMMLIDPTSTGKPGLQNYWASCVILPVPSDESDQDEESRAGVPTATYRCFIVDPFDSLDSPSFGAKLTQKSDGYEPFCSQKNWSA